MQIFLRLVWALAAAGAAEQTASFDGEGALAGWAVKGAVSVDNSRARTGASLKVAPGGVAVWKLGEADGAAKAEFWVYEDMTKPADPKERRVGPRWGLVSKDGNALVAGAIYAPYLGGEKTYAASDYRGDTWFNVSYLGECVRKEGWRRWTFTMDADKGLSIALDGQDVNAKRARFDWNRTKFQGAVGVAFYGDDAKGNAQTFWVDDVAVTLGGPMKVRPVPPPPPPPVVPATDPAPDKPVKLTDAGAGGHPRLLFGPDDVPRLRAFARSEAGKLWWDRLMNYLPSCKPPDHTNFLADATDGQRQGLWRMPTVALHYVLTGERSSLEAAVGFMKKLLDLEHWETGKELDSGMSAANIMIGAALAYDWTYDALEPAFREAFRRKILYHARAMYHGGHLMGNRSATNYWQQDPQNNHRWHRDAGLALCALAAYTGRPDEEWILAKTLAELKFVHDWLPEDGTSHEGPGYLIFGGAHLTLAMQASDRCFGTKHLDHPFFRSAALFRLHSLTPGLRDAFHFGDSAGLGGYNNFLFQACRRHRLRDAQAGIQRMAELNPNAFDFAWFSLLWVDPDLAGGDLANVPMNAFYPDLGLALLRDGWDDGNVGAMFKCGPYGGHKLNEYRNANGFHYLNVAHDDPDVNSFVLYARGALLAETSRYSGKKLTSSHNTILVNGKGQLGDGQGWTQPLKGRHQDMTKLGVVTAWKDAGEVIVVEGEGAGAYPDLTRFRRTFVWVKGRYVLVLDDIRAAKEAQITWLIQGPKLEALEAAAGRYVLAKDRARCEFQVVSDTEVEPTVAASTADHRGKALGWQQLQLRAKATACRFAGAYDPWGRGNVRVGMTPAGEGATITVTVGQEADTWTWAPPAEAACPARLAGKRDGNLLVEIAPADRPAAQPTQP